MLAETVTSCPSSWPVGKSFRPPPTLHENGVKSPYSIVQEELTHVEPEGQTRHVAPHAALSFVELTHKPLHDVNPPLQVTSHVVPEHVSVAFVVVVHVAQV